MLCDAGSGDAMIRLFCGFDKREQPGLHVFIGSVLRHASKPVSFTPLSSQGLTQGSNAFTLSRFLVARLCDFRGRAMFVDGSDMLAMEDIAQLDALFNPKYAVQVVKHPEYVSSHASKYVGTEMEVAQSNYPRKNWASVMLVNCEHSAWASLYTMLDSVPVSHALQFAFLSDDAIGDLPPEWNVLVDEGQDSTNAKLLHWTAGIPYFDHYSSAPRASDWFEAERRIS